jgi:hypothetical protein
LYGRFEIGVMYGPKSEDLAEMFDLEDFPGYFLVENVGGEIKWEKYEGKNMYRKILNWFISKVPDQVNFDGTEDESEEEEDQLPEAEVIKLHHQNYEFYLLQEHKPVIVQVTTKANQEIHKCWESFRSYYTQMFIFM